MPHLQVHFEILILVLRLHIGGYPLHFPTNKHSLLEFPTNRNSLLHLYVAMDPTILSSCTSFPLFNNNFDGQLLNSEASKVAENINIKCKQISTISEYKINE